MIRRVLAVLLLAACGLPEPSVADSDAPRIIAVSPAQWSRTSGADLVISGSNMDKIPASAPWSFPGCAVKSYSGSVRGDTVYDLSLMPDTDKVSLSDVCDLELGFTGQVVSRAFVTVP